MIRRKALLVFALALPAGCRDVLDVKGYGTPFYGQSDGIPYYSESCQKCMDDKCSDETSHCAGEPSCNALTTCLAACTVDDVACRTTCHLSVRRTSLASAVIACAANNCASSCAAGHAAPGGQQCATCLEKNASKAVAAFSKSVDALELESCQQDCPSGYPDKCECTPYAGGADLLSTLSNVPQCGGACGLADWSCLGHVQWPPPRAGTRPHLTLHVDAAIVGHENDSPNPLDGMMVTACNDVDVDCAVQGTGTLPGAGYADLDIKPSGANPYFSHLALDWTNESDRADAVFAFFPAQPLRNPMWTWRRIVPRSLADADVAPLGMAIMWESKAGLIWSAAACNNVPAEEITAELDSGERIYYLDKTLGLSETLSRTSHAALGAVINAEPGEKTMRLFTADGRQIGKYTFRLFTGAITTLALAPGPANPD